MLKPTLRGYIWFFCVYLSSTVTWLSRGHHDPNAHLSVLFTLFPFVLTYIFLSLIRQVNNWIEKGVCILSAISFALDAADNLHQFGYLPLGIPHSLSGLIFLFATILLGYRIDQILKESNREIETN